MRRLIGAASLLTACSGSDSAPRPNFVFVTSSLHSGNLGGPAGADASCAKAAADAGLDGTFIAWIQGTQFDRLSGSRGWTRVDGVAVADQPSELAARELLAPIAVDERGDRQETGVPHVWSGIGYDGSTNYNCGTWTDALSSDRGFAGDLRGEGQRLTDDFTVPTCDSPAHLACIEVGRVVPVSAPRATGRYAFVSSQVWTPAGLASADAACQTDATQAQLSGTYLAALPTSTQPTASRFDVSGPPWIRTDAVLVAPTARQLFASDYLATFIDRRADGQPAALSTSWWGGDPLATLASSATCLDWIDTQHSYGPGIGRADTTDRSTLFGVGAAGYCDEPHHLLCLQQ